MVCWAILALHQSPTLQQCCIPNVCLIDTATSSASVRIVHLRCRGHSRRNSLRRVPKGKWIAVAAETLIFRTCRDRGIHCVTRFQTRLRCLVEVKARNSFCVLCTRRWQLLVHFLWRRKQFIISDVSLSCFPPLLAARRPSHIPNTLSSIVLSLPIVTSVSPVPSNVTDMTDFLNWQDAQGPMYRAGLFQVLVGQVKSCEGK